MATSSITTVPCDIGEMNLHVWVPDSGVGPGVLLIQEIFGVGPYIRAVAERLADAGYVVGAPDVFWRFAPGWASSHDAEGLAASMDAVGKLDAGRAVEDCIAALGALEALDSVEGSPAVMGFCLGGTLAWAVAGHASPAACVSYYGSGVPDMIDLLDQVTCPTLFHFGSTDDYIAAEGVERLAEALGGRPGFVLNVEKAGHAFDNHESEIFYDAAAARAAWAKTMAFLTEHHPVEPHPVEPHPVEPDGTSA